MIRRNFYCIKETYEMDKEKEIEEMTEAVMCANKRRKKVKNGKKSAEKVRKSVV